jgi:hypothetical protein
VRESANRTTCQNNLKQIGLACHGYHDAVGTLPSAGSGDSGNPPTNRLDWGWTYEILPFIEQDNLFRNTNNSAVRGAVVKTFYCPSRRSPRTFPGGGRSDYAGNGGTRANSDGSTATVVRARGSAGSYAGPRCGLSAGIPDGSSNTLLVGEKMVNVPTMGGSAVDFADNESWAGPGFPDADIMRGCLPVGSSWRVPIRDTHDAVPADCWWRCR